MESGEAAEGLLSGSLGDVRESLHNFSDSVDASLEGDGRHEVAALGVGLPLGDLVVALVSLEEGDNALGALLALDLLGREADGVGVDEAGLRGVVEAGQVEGIAGELLSIRLHEEGVVLLGELPHDFAGDLHCLHTNT